MGKFVCHFKIIALIVIKRACTLTLLVHGNYPLTKMNDDWAIGEGELNFASKIPLLKLRTFYFLGPKTSSPMV